MSENKPKLSWLKSRKESLTGKVKGLYCFKEGTTCVTFSAEIEPEIKRISGKLKPIYTVTIEGKTEKFTPSKTLEGMILEQLEAGNWTLEVTRQGLDIENTQYSVAPHKSKKA